MQMRLKICIYKEEDVDETEDIIKEEDIDETEDIYQDEDVT